VVVHDVKVDYVGAGSEHVVDLLAETGEIGGEDGRGDKVIVHLTSPDIQLRGAKSGAKREGRGGFC